MNFNQADTLFLLDKLPDLVLLLDEHGNIRYVNQRSQELLGEKDKLIGKQFRDLVNKQDLEKLPQQLKDWNNWRNRHGFPWEIKIQLLDGRWQLVSGSAKELLTSELESTDNLQGVLITLRPIGKPDDTSISRDLLMAAIEAADSSIVVADANREDLPLIYVNRGFLELTGYSEAEVLGQNCRFLQFCDNDTNSYTENRAELAKIRKALNTGGSVNVILRNYRQNGSLFHNDLYLTPVYERERIIAFVGVQNDITKRVLAQEQFKERERTLNSLFTATDALLGIVELPSNAPICHVLMNAKAKNFFQLQKTAETEITLSSLGFSSKIQKQWQEAFERCLQTKKVVRFKCKLERGGECRHLRVTVNPIETEPEAILRCCYVAEDVTDLDRAEAKRMLMEAAVENTQESIVITTPELDKSSNSPEIVYVNKAFTEITGYERQEAIGKTPRILQGAMSDPAVLSRLRENLQEKRSFRGETINYHKDGSTFIIQWNIAPILDENDEVAYWVAAQRNVTRRRELEKEVLEIQAREQERIARDLHDSVQQDLNVIGMLASLIQYQFLKRSTSPQLEQLLQRLFNTSKQASQRVRAISHSLHPVSIERNGLMTALQHLATTTQEVFDVECEFTFEQPILSEDRSLATHLYRIVQEAINNAIRHGRAKQILIGLAKNERDRYTLTIKDNGVGISEEALKAESGIGLNSMRYRAEIIDGELSIENGKNGGTVIICTFDGEEEPI